MNRQGRLGRLAMIGQSGGILRRIDARNGTNQKSQGFVFLRGHGLNALDRAFERQHLLLHSGSAQFFVLQPSFSSEIEARKFVNDSSELSRVVPGRFDDAREDSVMTSSSLPKPVPILGPWKIRTFMVR
jgi:hypothetical protein